MKYTFYKNSKYEILENVHGNCFVKKMDNKKIYYKKSLHIVKEQFDSIETISWSYKDTLFTVVILFSVAIFSYLTYCIFTSKIYYDGYKQKLFSFTFLLINIIVHELGHTSSLIFFGKKRGQYKLKWFWLFPMVMVDTSEAYMLPKFEAASICYAGIMNNILLSGLVLLCYPNGLYLIIPTYNLIVFNLLPLGKVKTDGYHILINFILGINDYKFKKNKLTYLFEFLFYLLAMLIALNTLKSLFR